MYYCVNMALHVHLGGGEALVGVILIGHCSPHRGTFFQVQDMYRLLTLMWDRKCEESRTVA